MTTVQIADCTVQKKRKTTAILVWAIFALCVIYEFRKHVQLR